MQLIAVVVDNDERLIDKYESDGQETSACRLAREVSRLGRRYTHASDTDRGARTHAREGGEWDATRQQALR